MLGPSVLFFGPPFSMGFALRAYEGADSKFSAILAVLLAAIELLLMLLLTVIAVFS